MTFLDRIFYVRQGSEGAVEHPRDASDVLGAALADESAIWEVLRADFPADAFVAVRDDLARTDPSSSTVMRLARLTGDQAAQRHAERQGRSQAL